MCIGAFFMVKCNKKWYNYKMFGYVCPLKSELRIREYEVYKSYYCGLCKTLKKNYGFISSLFLSNDCTFLYMVCDSLEEEFVCEPCKCGVHPFRKCAKAVSKWADYAAAVNVLLAYGKLADDKKDSKKGYVLSFLLKRAYKKALKKYSNVNDYIKGMLETLWKCESEKSGDTDKTAHSFAVMLGRIFEEADENQWEELYDFGYNLGRWIYLADAADDIKKDIKSGEYNVFLQKYGNVALKDIKDEVAFSLNISLAKAKEAFNKIKIKKNKEIIENVICLGLPDNTNKVLKGEKVGSL